MSPSPSSSGLLPMPGTPAWRARIASVFRNADAHVLVAFWLFGTPTPSIPWHRLSRYAGVSLSVS